MGTDEMTIAEILTQHESKTLDFKRDLSSKKGILKDLVSFANTSGGLLILGVDDDKTVGGIDDPLAAEEKLASLISDSISPALLPDIEIATHEGKHILIVRVARSGGPFFLTADGPDNGVFVRVGSTSRRADAPTVAELRRSIANVSFDQEPTPVGRDGLDEVRLEATLHPHGIATTDAKLATLGVLVAHQNATLASNGGVILFGRDEERQRLFPDAHVRCAAFAGETKGAEMLDKLDLRDSSLVEALDEIIHFIRRNTRTAGIVKEMRRNDIPEYSTEILREILVNALAHADYSLIGMQVKVAIFSDRMEIENPGFLPFGMTIEQLKAGQSKIRNRVIARVFDEINYLDGWGRAWERIQDAMKGGYPEPEFVEQGAAFKVILHPHPSFSDISNVRENVRDPDAPDRKRRAVPKPDDRKQWILEEIDARGGIKVPEIVEGLGVNQKMAERDVRSLVNEGIVEFVGSPRMGRYQRQAST